MLPNSDKKKKMLLHPEQKRRYQQMSAADKIECALRLRKAAWELKWCGLRSQHPDWSEERLHQKVRELFLYART